TLHTAILIYSLSRVHPYQHTFPTRRSSDLNTVDSALIKSRLFKGLEFMFDNLDTSRITGKTYLPMFLNETFSKVYGDNTTKRERSEEHTSELQSRENLVCRLLLEKKNHILDRQLHPHILRRQLRQCLPRRCDRPGARADACSKRSRAGTCTTMRTRRRTPTRRRRV